MQADAIVQFVSDNWDRNGGWLCAEDLKVPTVAANRYDLKDP
jgi:hypothetical protein